jgi:hypothetical protein
MVNTEMSSLNASRQHQFLEADLARDTFCDEIQHSVRFVQRQPLFPGFAVDLSGDAPSPLTCKHLSSASTLAQFLLANTLVWLD